MDLLTEYWASEAGRGKLRDILENADRTTEGIKRILTKRDSNGNLQILKSVEAESLLQKFMRTGFVDTKGKTQQQVKQELEQRFGGLAKNGVRVYFYSGSEDVDTSNMDESTITKLMANGFAVTKDGTIWINKDYVDSGKLIDFNKTTQHEIGHIVFGEDSEFQAQYLEAAYGNFLQEISDNGYLNDNEGIRNYQDSLLTFQEIARLNGYTEEEIQLAVDGALRGFLGDKFTNKIQATAVDIGKKIAGEKGESVVKKLIEADKKFFNEEGRKVGSAVRKAVKTATGKDTHKLGDKAEAKITQIQKNAKARQQEREKAKVQKAQQKAQEDRIYKEEKPKDLAEMEDFISLKGKLPKGTKIVFELENGQRVEIGSMEELKYGSPEEQALVKEYADRINANIREQEIAKREKNISRLENLQKEEERLLNEQRSIFSTRTSPFGRITDALNLVESAKSYKDGVLVVNASKYSREIGSDYTAMGMEMFGKVETLAAMSRAGLPRIEFSKNTGSGVSKLLNPNKVYGNSQRVFINDGTSGGTTIANQTVLANQNGMLIRQTNLHTGETLRRAINPVGDVVYSYSSYSSVANPALLQIGRTTGQNLLPPPNYDLVYSQSVIEKAIEPYHRTPVYFDLDMINYGTSMIRSDGRIEYMMKGSINGVDGVYHTTIRDGNYVIHKNFVPKEKWINYKDNHNLPEYNQIK